MKPTGGQLGLHCMEHHITTGQHIQTQTSDVPGCSTPQYMLTFRLGHLTCIALSAIFCASAKLMSVLPLPTWPVPPNTTHSLQHKCSTKMQHTLLV
jgi:hypothetical protein